MKTLRNMGGVCGMGEQKNVEGDNFSHTAPQDLKRNSPYKSILASFVYHTNQQNRHMWGCQCLAYLNLSYLFKITWSGKRHHKQFLLLD